MTLADQTSFAEALRAPRADTTPRGLAVYRNNRRAALIDSLSATFAASARITGEPFFAAMAGAFVAAHPPLSPVLHEYGEKFADFIAAYAPAAELAYLADVVRLEWAWMRAYHAADIEPLGVQALAGLGDVALLSAMPRLHPSFSLIRSAFPIGTIWQMNRDGGEAAPIDDWRGQNIAVLRPHMDVQVRIIGDDAAVFLSALGAGATLGDAIDLACAHHPDFDPATHLAGMFSLGAVAGLDLPHEEKDI